MNGIVKQEMLDCWMNIQEQRPAFLGAVPPSCVFDEELKRPEERDGAHQEQLVKKYTENCHVDIRLHVLRKQLKRANAKMNAGAPGSSNATYTTKTKTAKASSSTARMSTAPKRKTVKPRSDVVNASLSRPKPTSVIKSLAPQRSRPNAERHDGESIVNDRMPTDEANYPPCLRNYTFWAAAAVNMETDDDFCKVVYVGKRIDAKKLFDDTLIRQQEIADQRPKPTGDYDAASTSHSASLAPISPTTAAVRGLLRGVTDDELKRDIPINRRIEHVWIEHNSKKNTYAGTILTVDSSGMCKIRYDGFDCLYFVKIKELLEDYRLGDLKFV